MPKHSSGAFRGPVLTSLQREQFLKTGVAHLPGLVPKAATDEMRDRLWDLLAKQHRMIRGRPETWTTPRPTRLQALKRTGALDIMAGAGLTALLDEVFAAPGWIRPSHWGQALVTFRDGPAPWTVPSVAWHVDMIDDRVLQPWPHYVRLFVLLAPLAPGGGGTVYLLGSHRIVMQLMAEAKSPDEKRCAPLKETLKRQSPWIMDLCSPGPADGRIERFMQAGEMVRGVELQVGEMTGEAGDVILMHPGVLHAAAPCARSEPRLVVAETIIAKGYDPRGG